MLREIALSAALMAFAAGAAHAAPCPGQTGKTIFSDDFSDDSGGWDLDSNESYVPNALQIKATPKNNGTGSHNQTFNAINADYCAVIDFPTDPAEANNKDFAAITFMAKDYNNRFQMSIYSDGTAAIWRSQAGNWSTLLPYTKEASVNTAPGAENTLRVVVKDQKITFFINGSQVKVLRAQTSDTDNRFGFFAGPFNNITAKERIYLVKSFSVTEAP